MAKALGARGITHFTHRIYKILAIGFKFTQHLVDSYDRDNKMQWHDDGDESKWLKQCKVLQKIPSYPLRISQLSNGIKEMHSHFRPRPHFNAEGEIFIQDSMERICWYLVEVTHFINDYITKDSDDVFPLQIELIFATKLVETSNCGPPSLPWNLKRFLDGDKPYKHSNFRDEYEYDDDDEDEDEESDEYDSDSSFYDGAYTMDEITFTERLESCLDDGEYVIESVTNLRSILMKLRKCYDEFVNKMRNKYDNTYPKQTRFCIMIQRNGTQKCIDDDIIIFNPKNKNYENKICDDHIPQTFFDLYHEELFDGISLKDDPHGLLNFSFHIESLGEIKCYFHHFGYSQLYGIYRFYPQDILDIFPAIFDKKYLRKANKEFLKSDRLKAMMNGMLIHDPCFEYFYRHLTGKSNDEFPMRFGDHVWINSIQYLVFGYLHRNLQQIFVNDICNIVVLYLE